MRLTESPGSRSCLVLAALFRRPPAAPNAPASATAKRARAVTVTALDGRVFEPPPRRPPWLRPLVVLIVIALHAAALFFVALTPKTPEQSGEVIVDIQPEASPENPAAPADEPKLPEQSAPPPAQDAAPAPTHCPSRPKAAPMRL